MKATIANMHKASGLDPVAVCPRHPDTRYSANPAKYPHIPPGDVMCCPHCGGAMVLAKVGVIEVLAEIPAELVGELKERVEVPGEMRIPGEMRVEVPGDPSNGTHWI